MKQLILLSFLFSSFIGFSQSDSTLNQKSNFEFFNFTPKNKGKLFLHWGYNRGWYTKSDIHFYGEGFDFTLYDVVAKDRPTPFQWGHYLAPQNLTIPQTNLKIGYFIKNRWSLCFGVDHMKYVMQNKQTVLMDGYVDVGSEHDGTYDNEEKNLEGSSFVLFEHTDGLNYINIEADYWTPLINWKNKIILQHNIGGGTGFLLPKTNVTMFRTNHRDDFNIAGFGVNVKTGVDLRFWDYFFLHTDFKTGYINMPNVRISKDKSEGADQQFGFAEFDFLFGFNYNLGGKKKKFKVTGTPSF